MRPSRLYGFLRPIVGALIRLFIRLEIQGRERMPRSGPLLLVTNHLNLLDVPMLGIVLPREAVVLAADKWKHTPVLSYLLAHAGHAIWIHREAMDRQALSQALDVLSRGEVLGIAPEGTRSKTGALQEAHTGVAYLASRSGAPIQLIAVSGQEKVISTLQHFKRPVVRVVFDEPFTLPGTPNRARGRQLNEYTKEIMIRLAALLPPEYRGVYDDAQQRGV